MLFDILWENLSGIFQNINSSNKSEYVKILHKMCI